MTNQKRAKDIVRHIYPFDVQPREWVDFITSQLDEAVREALEPYEHYTLPNGDEINVLTEAVEEMNASYSQGKKEGFASGITQAAGVADRVAKECVPYHEDWKFKPRYETANSIAVNIRALRPTSEEG